MNFMSYCLLAGVFAPFLGCALSFIPQKNGLLASLMMTLAASASLYLFFSYDGNSLTWILFPLIRVEDLHSSWSLYVDNITVMMMIIINMVSCAVHWYAMCYMKKDTSAQRFFIYLCFFTFSMLVLVVASDMIQLLVGWEAVGLSSYLLIGFWYEKESANNAAFKAFLFNRCADACLFVGVGLLFFAYGSVIIPEMIRTDTMLSPILLTMTTLLIFLGAMGKSAQIFFHAWLPDAMEGPTPVSALIHAATMVTAGVFLLIRLIPIFEAETIIMPVIIIIGTATALMAASLAIVTYDIKKIIAYSTCSQLGFMFAAIGASGWWAGFFHLYTHAFFKALLFLGVGAVITVHHHEQDIRKMGNLLKKIPWTAGLMLLGILSLTGVPLTSGGLSKHAILEVLYNTGTTVGLICFILLMLASFMTALYSWRMMIMVFAPRGRNDDASPKIMGSTPLGLFLPMLFLGVIVLCSGWLYDWFVTLQFPHHGEEHGSASLFLDVITWLAIGSGTATAFYFSFFYPQRKETVVKTFPWMYRFLINLWYFDKIYDLIFWRPLMALTRFSLVFIERKLIDGSMIAMTLKTVTSLSKGTTHLQTGFLPHYATGIFVGIGIGLIIYLILYIF